MSTSQKGDEALHVSLELVQKVMNAEEAEEVQSAKVGYDLQQERPGDAARLHKAAHNEPAAVNLEWLGAPRSRCSTAAAVMHAICRRSRK